MKLLKLFCILIIAALSMSFTQAFDFIYKYGKHRKDWAMVLNDNKFGFIDKEGDLVVPVKYDYIYKYGKYKEGWALVNIDNKFGFIDHDGDEVVPTQYDYIYKFNKKTKLAKALKDGKMVLLDMDGDER